jgi:glycosyltransferase involved in cell wall biosynthesis
MKCISVIVPCRNEIRYIDKFMQCLFGQELPAGCTMDVFIADGMSKDGTREKLESYRKLHPEITVISNPAGIVPTGLNAVIPHTGDIVIRMDVHTEYASDYIRQCVEVLEETGADNVGGAARTAATNYVQNAIQLAYHSFLGSGGARFHNPDYEGFVDTVLYGCWRKSTLLELGGFDEVLVRNQDDELNLRLILRGGKIWQSKRIRAWLHPRSSFRGLFMQYYQYGYWKIHVIRKHSRPASWRHLVPAAFVFTIAMLAALSLVSPAAGWTLAALMAVYGAAVVGVSTALCFPSRLRYLPAVPLVFLIYHFSYGSGFLRCMFDVLLGNKPQPKAASKAEAIAR